jgi:hypothetical protein
MISVPIPVTINANRVESPSRYSEKFNPSDGIHGILKVRALPEGICEKVYRTRMKADRGKIESSQPMRTALRRKFLKVAARRLPEAIIRSGIIRITICMNLNPWSLHHVNYFVSKNVRQS